MTAKLRTARKAWVLAMFAALLAAFTLVLARSGPLGDSPLTLWPPVGVFGFWPVALVL